MSDVDVIYKSIISKRDTRQYTDGPGHPARGHLK